MSISTNFRVNVKEFLMAGFIMLSVFGLAMVNSGPARAAELSLEQRIQRIEDEKEIRDIMILYGQYLDSKNFAAYSELFAREGTWSGGTTNNIPVKGPKVIQETMEKAFAERIYDPKHITNLHIVTNQKVDVDGDRATGYSKFTVMSRNEKDEPFVRVAGHYEDAYIREDGRWKILSRVAHRDIPD